MEMIFHSHANKKLISDKKSFALGLILRVRVFYLGSGLLSALEKLSVEETVATAWQH